MADDKQQGHSNSEKTATDSARNRGVTAPSQEKLDEKTAPKQTPGANPNGPPNR